MALGNESSWQKDSLCREYPRLDFFPPESDIPAVKAAKKVCKDCLVRTECLDNAILTKQPDGIWGGFTTTERKRVGPVRQLMLVSNNSVSASPPPVVLNQKPFKLRTATPFSLRVP